MKITITAPDGANIETTKGNAHGDLLDYIVKNCPEAWQEIRTARAEIKKLNEQTHAIKQDILTRYSFRILA